MDAEKGNAMKNQLKGACMEQDATLLSPQSLQNAPCRRRGGRKRRYTVDQLIAVLKASGGKIASAARSLGCDRTVIYRYKEKYPQIDEVMTEAREYQLDVTELKLFEAINQGEPWAITLYLKTQGKARGYSERLEEVRKPDGHVVQPEKKPTLDYSRLTINERKQLLGFIQKAKRIEEPPAIGQGEGNSLSVT